MSNHPLSHGKTMYDLFNMINPNCYQAFIIQCIIENKKEEAIQCCEELSTAFEYYKWDSSGKQSGYIDSLVCESNLEKWQKIAIIHIVSNDVANCKSIIENRIADEQEEATNRKNYAKQCRDSGRSPLDDLYRLFGLSVDN